MLDAPESSRNRPSALSNSSSNWTVGIRVQSSISRTGLNRVAAIQAFSNILQSWKRIYRTHPGSFESVPLIASSTTGEILHKFAVAAGVTVRNEQASVTPFPV